MLNKMSRIQRFRSRQRGMRGKGRMKSKAIGILIAGLIVVGMAVWATVYVTGLYHAKTLKTKMEAERRAKINFTRQTIEDYIKRCKLRDNDQFDRGSTNYLLSSYQHGLTKINAAAQNNDIGVVPLEAMIGGGAGDSGMIWIIQWIDLDSIVIGVRVVDDDGNLAEMYWDRAFDDRTTGIYLHNGLHEVEYKLSMHPGALNLTKPEVPGQWHFGNIDFPFDLLSKRLRISLINRNHTESESIAVYILDNPATRPSSE